MVDRIFSEPVLAKLYDYLAPWGEADDIFYLELVMSAASVLDVGCGTGQLLREARNAGHTGRLCGLDPAKAMLDIAGRCSGIDWIPGNLGAVRWEQEFDLIVMTGHAFQVFVDDEELKASLAKIRSALTPDGRFAFETRNPLARVWENWIPANVVEVTTPSSNVVRFSREVQTPVEGDIVHFTSTFTCDSWNQPEKSKSTLRFLDAVSLTRFLSDAELEIEQQFGEWDRRPLVDTSPEIITIAMRR